MECTVMGSLKFQLPQLRFPQNPQTHKPQFPKIACGLRGGPRKPLWRSRVLSTEAIQAVQSLKLAKSSIKLEEVFSSRVSRLLKSDLLDTLAELQRQGELDLTLKVFEFIRKEVWYKPDLSLYSDMIMILGKKKLIEMAEGLFSELKKEGLEPDTRVYTEMIGAYLQVGMTEKAMEMYGLMKASGCAPDKLTLTILIRNLENAGEEELAAGVKKECEEYVDYPKKFLEEIEKKYNTASLPNALQCCNKALLLKMEMEFIKCREKETRGMQMPVPQCSMAEREIVDEAFSQKDGRSTLFDNFQNFTKLAELLLEKHLCC